MRPWLPLALLLLPPLGGLSLAEPESGPRGTARLAVVGKIETLDPATCDSEASRAAVANLFDPLFEYHHTKRPFELAPCLAEALPDVSEDRTTHTIRLKKGVRFIDDECFPGGKGREFTARDVVYCIKRVMDAQTKSPAQWMLARKIVGLDAFTEASKKVKPDPRRQVYCEENGFPEVAGLEVLDDHTLAIHLLEPTPELPWLLASQWFSIYAPESVRFYGEQVGRHAVGTGPFRVLIYLDQERLSLRPNPTYREDRFPTEGELPDERTAGRRLPLSRVVEVRAFETDMAAWSAFLSGALDHAEIPRDALEAAVDLQKGRPLPFLGERGVRLNRNPRLEILYDAFNYEDPVLGQPAGEKGRAIRRAICLAADDGRVMHEYYRNVSERVYGPILPEFRGYDEDFVNEWTRLEGEPREEALDLARKTLAEAGLEGGKGVPVIHMHIPTGTVNRRIFDALQKQVADVGIRLEPVVVPWKEMQALLRAGKLQMWTSSWYADYPDAQNFLQLFYGPNKREPNYSNYASKAFDKLYREARALPPSEDPGPIYEEMQDVVMQDCPWRFRFRRIRHAASHDWLRGYRHNDLVPRIWKYCAVDDEERARSMDGWK